ncbi:putative phage abortive infection protein [Comamonas terrigena]|uniref:putative phage abortive infection protein n=1 Tax=Comamonas terrigena TaxID=32013 RepID=UPI0028969828|nr:putative phage abortive infection protein [Comamonas terrigena]
MTFIFWTGLSSLVFLALCIGIKPIITNGLLSIFDVVLPDEENSIDKNLKLKIAKSAAYILCAVLLVLYISIFLSFILPYHQSWADAANAAATTAEAGENKYTGPLGDLFNGLVTPVLTFLTFCGLLITILIQNAQMKSTLKELELNRKEMENSTKALQAQVKSSEEQVKSSQEQVKNSQAQKFDSNFYSMLQLHSDVAEKLNKNTNVINEEFREINLKSYEWSEFKNPNELRSFFLINYQILKFIRKNEDDETISKSEAKQYSNIVRAMLNDELYGLIFFNCSDKRFKKYKNLIEYYNFLEHFVFSRFEDPYVLKIIHDYDKKVFGDEENLNNSLKKKEGVMTAFIKKYIFSFCNELKEYFGYKDYEFYASHPGMRDFEDYRKEKYSAAALLAEKLDIFEKEIINSISKIKSSDFLDNVAVINDLSYKRDLIILKKLGFNFNAYISVIDEIYNVTENFNGLFSFVVPHVERIKEEINK